MNASFIEPPPVHGVNVWILSQALRCRHRGLTPEQAAIGIYAAGRGKLRDGRFLNQRELERAVRKAYSTQCPTMTGRGTFISKPKKPQFHPEALAKLPPFTLEDLRAASPFPEPWNAPQLQILWTLFPARSGLLCIGKSAKEFRTGTVYEHREADTLKNAALIVPAYMTARKGKTQAGHFSAHSLENTGPRRYVVADFDIPSPADQPRIIRHLARFRHLVAVVSSGGKSLHAWFPAYGGANDEKFWQLAITYGADPVIMRNHSSFVRMPGGLRNNGNRQTVHFFNPDGAKIAWQLSRKGGAQ